MYKLWTTFYIYTESTYLYISQSLLMLTAESRSVFLSFYSTLFCLPFSHSQLALFFYVSLFIIFKPFSLSLAISLSILSLFQHLFCFVYSYLSFFFFHPLSLVHLLSVWEKIFLFKSLKFFTTFWFSEQAEKLGEQLIFEREDNGVTGCLKLTLHKNFLVSSVNGN
jgi:hypothetical protein